MDHTPEDESPFFSVVRGSSRCHPISHFPFGHVVQCRKVMKILQGRPMVAFTHPVLGWVAPGTEQPFSKTSQFSTQKVDPVH